MLSCIYLSKARETCSDLHIDIIIIHWTYVIYIIGQLKISLSIHTQHTHTHTLYTAGKQATNSINTGTGKSHNQTDPPPPLYNCEAWTQPPLEPRHLGVHQTPGGPPEPHQGGRGAIKVKAGVVARRRHTHTPPKQQQQQQTTTAATEKQPESQRGPVAARLHSPE